MRIQNRRTHPQTGNNRPVKKQNKARITEWKPAANKHARP